MQRVILVPRKLVLPEAMTFSSEILGTYQEEMQSYNKKARKTLDVLSDQNGELAGNNCFAPLEFRKYLPKEIRLSTMADLGLATERRPEFLLGFYSVTGLVLRTEGDSYPENDLLAKGLAKQLKGRGIPLKEGVPKIIYFEALNLKENKDSAYGLVYSLNGKAEIDKNIFDAPELVREYRFKTMDERGVAVENACGQRTCYTRKDGLSDFYLGMYSSLYSGNPRLAFSGRGGRIVGVIN